MPREPGEQTTIQEVYAGTVRVLAWAALIFLTLMGGSLLECVHKPTGPLPPREPTPIELCSKACGDRFTYFVDTCKQCDMVPNVGWVDRPFVCSCVPQLDGGAR